MNAQQGSTLSLIRCAAVHNWVAGQAEHRVVEIEYPTSVEYDAPLETVLQPSSLDRIGLDFREQRIVEALNSRMVVTLIARMKR
jgi:hypothetical protein